MEALYWKYRIWEIELPQISQCHMFIKSCCGSDKISGETMRYLNALFLFVALLITGGCTSPFPSPQAAGMAPVAPNIHAEPSIDGKGRAELIRAVADARQLVGSAFGGIVTNPVIYACATDACYERIGGSYGSSAQALDDRILLSPYGLSKHYLAHEWVHAELYARMKPAAWRGVPQWFNEGLAVTISQEPEHSESFLQSMLDAHLPVPRPDEVKSLRTLSQWGNAIGFNERQQNALGVKSDGNPLYAAAGQVVRPWFLQVGRGGLNELIRRMNAGQPFDMAYQAVGGRY